MDWWMLWGNVCGHSCSSDKKRFTFHSYTLHTPLVCAHVSFSVCRPSSSSSPPLCHCESALLPISLRFFLLLHPAPCFLSYTLCLVLSLLWNSFAHHPAPHPHLHTLLALPTTTLLHYSAWVLFGMASVVPEYLSSRCTPCSITLEFNPFPAPEKTQTTTHKRLDTAHRCTRAHSWIYTRTFTFQVCSQTNAKQFSHLPCHECCSSLFPFLSSPNASRGGPQRSLKQQLQADAGPDYNRTRRLLFITTSSTEPKHFCREPRLYITEQGHCSSEDKKKRERDIRGNMPLQFITYKRSEWKRKEIKKKMQKSCFKRVACDF